MKDICIVVCNYNGKEYLTACIDSLKAQTIDGIEICVVDNASTDGSDGLLRSYGEDIHVIYNSENLGGAGGFEAGVQYALSEGYRYIGLFDNDIRVAHDAVELMLKRLQTDPKCGIVGTIALFMDAPETVMWYGYKIDFDNYSFYELNKSRKYVKDELPEELECDYVPTCATLTRRETLLECGTMPVENFIYQDDVEMVHKMRLKGYSAIMLRDAVVWHKGGGTDKGKSTFGMYYQLRNRYHFMAKYLPEDRLPGFKEWIFGYTFSQVSGCYYKGKNALYTVYWYAFSDFINGIRGKAREGRIVPMDEEDFSWIGDIIRDSDEVVIEGNSSISGYDRAVRRIKEKVGIYKPGIHVVCSETPINPTEGKTVFVVLSHANNVKENVLPKIGLDEYLNVIRNEDDYVFFRSADIRRNMFFSLYGKLFDERVSIIRCNGEISND